MHLPSRAPRLSVLFAMTLRAQDWTEAQVVELFLSQSPIVREARAQMAIGAAEYRGKTALSNPSISVSREGAGRTEFYQASQSLPTSGRRPLLRQAGVVQAQALEQEGRFNLWRARCQLRLAFFRLLSAQLRAEALGEAAQEMESVIEILAAREREGEGSKVDRMRAERERTELRAEWGLGEASMAIERGELLAFLPKTAGMLRAAGSLELPVIPSEAAELVEKALAARPDIQAERKRMEQYHWEERAAERLRVPEPTIFAGLKRAEVGQAGIANGAVGGVSLTIPILNQGKSEVARFQAEQERTAARLELLARRVEAEVSAELQSLQRRKEARDRYAREVEPASQEMVRIATAAYEEGEISILQLLDAYRMKRLGRMRLIELQAAAKEAQIALEAALGEEFAR